MDDNDMLTKQVQYLERENRKLRSTLRDGFAQAALTGLIAKHCDAGWHPDGEIRSMDGAAQTAYEYADYMLRARQS